MWILSNRNSKRLISFFTLIVLALLSENAMAQYDLVVSQDGTGNYSTVQAAVNAAPAGRTTPYVIYIKNGTYNEKITIPSTKPFIKLEGENVAHVILTYSDYAAKLTSCTNTVGTQNSASFSVNANDFSAVNISFVNSYGDGSQAVALLVNADRAVFLNCRFMANQDTIYLKGSGTPRNYFKNCYIDGNVDFIFGSAIALFDSCVIYAKSRTTAGTSYVTAPNTPNGQAYGFVFRDARLPKNMGLTQYYLSRPWPSPDVASTKQKAIFLSSRMSTHIKPEGWSIWDVNTVTANLYYGEYNSLYFNGAAYDISQRVSWSYQLNAADSATYSQTNIFGAWNPCATVPELCGTQNTSLAVSNFKGVKGVASSQFSWNTTWPVSGIEYTLYKSTDNVTYLPVYSYTEPTDSAINFNYTDASLPASGAAWYYYVSAAHLGYVTEVTDTVVISNKADLVVNAAASLHYCGFSQLLGAPSATQTFTITGTNLNGIVTIMPPLSYEVSADNINWYNNSSPLVVSPTSGNISTTTIYIRLNAAAVGLYNGNVIISTSGISDYSVPVSGVTFAASTSFPLQHWPLTQNNNDSVAVRSAAVIASTSSLMRLFTSDGTQPSASPIPAYSGQYGQSLGANTAGNNWSNIGSTLNRSYYEQFTVTAAAGSQVRIDSVTFLSDFYNTISGIKMGAVYSKNGFATPADSIEFSSGVGSGGVTLTLASSGSFAKSFTLQRNDAGPINKYALSLNGVDGVTLNSGETITIRLYWACGSTGTPRFAFLKDVKVTGVVLSPLPLMLTSFTVQQKKDKNLLTWSAVNENDLKKFEIEKSKDNIHFEKIATMLPNGNVRGSYHYYDMQPWNLQYYRIKLIQWDGNIFYSAVKVIKNENVTIRIFPNPVTDQLIVSHEAVVRNSEITVLDLLGKEIATIPVDFGTNQTVLSFSNFAKGIYYVVFYDGLVKKSFKVIKK